MFDEYEPPGASVWQRVNRLLWVLLILTVVALIIGAFLPELQKQRTEREARASLQRSIDEQKQLVSHHQREIGWLTNDPEYLAIIAGDRLDMMREGTMVFRLEPPKAPALQAEAPAPTLQTRKSKSLD